MIQNSKKSKLTGKSLNTNWNDDKIYINDCLTHFNTNLFFKTKAYACDKGYKYVWFKDSKIFIKKNDQIKVIIICDDQSLLKLD